MNAGGRAMKASDMTMGAACRSTVVGLAAVVALAATAIDAYAGKNAGGYLVFYTNDSVVYTSDDEPYAGKSGVTCPEDTQFPCPPYDGNNCSANKSIVQAAASSTKTNDYVVWWLLAGWPEETCPRLAALQFGIQYDETKVSINSSGTDADFELTTARNGRDWPAPGSGTALTWNSPRTSHLKEVYWFTGYVYAEAATFSVAIHPAGNSWPVFGDDDTPAGLDEIGSGYGGTPNVNFLPVLGLAGSLDGNNGDITPIRKQTWGGVKALYGR